MPSEAPPPGALGGAKTTTGAAPAKSAPYPKPGEADFGFDPASASAPFIATFVDVMGLIIYFNVALHLLLR